MKKAYSYARVSTGKQRDGISTESQHIRNRKDCQLIGFEVVKEFTEVESGRDDDRPVMEEMLNECKRRARGKDAIKLIAVHDWDRLTRDTLKSAIWINKFKEIGVDINCPQPHLWRDDEDAGSIIMHALRTGMAHGESVNISRRTRRCNYSLKEQGFWVYTPPHGYIRTSKDERGRWQIVPDPQLQEIYQSAFRLIATGTPALHAYKQLGGRKVFKAKQTFLDAIRNPLYGGKVLAKTSLSGYETKLVEGRFNGIVSWELFQLANDVMAGKVKPGKTKESDSLFPAKRSLLCPTCHGHVSSDMPHKKLANGDIKVYHYYRCIKTQQHYRVSVEKVNEALANMLTDLKVSEDSKTVLLEKLKERTEKERRSLSAKLVAANEKVARETERIARALKLLVDGSITRSEYDVLLKEKSELEADAQKIQTQLNRLEAVKNFFRTFVDDLGAVIDRIEGAGLHKLLRVVFPEGFVLDGHIFRTSRINTLFLLVPDKQRLWKTIEINQSLFSAKSADMGATADYFRTDLEQLAMFIHQHKAA